MKTVYFDVDTQLEGCGAAQNIDLTADKLLLQVGSRLAG